MILENISLKFIYNIKIFFENFASMKKFVCLDVPKPNNIMRHESNSEHSTPLATFPRGAGCKIQHIDCKIIFGNKM